MRFASRGREWGAGKLSGSAWVPPVMGNGGLKIEADVPAPRNGMWYGVGENEVAVTRLDLGGEERGIP